MESNHRHEALQASALPLSYPGTPHLFTPSIQAHTENILPTLSPEVKH